MDTPELFIIDSNKFSQTIDDDTAQLATQNLEKGNVVYFPNLAFSLLDEEQQFLKADVVKEGTKNVSYNPNNGQLKGHNVLGDKTIHLHNMLKRYSAFSENLVRNITPKYQKDILIGRTSYRTKEAKDRDSASQRKDDRLLHVDAFPSQPVHGKRILRVFTNVNPQGKPRIWKLGTNFNNVIDKFFNKIRYKFPLESELMHLLKITKSKRTLYDHAMLAIHNHMKSCDSWQTTSPQEIYKFSIGTTWMVYTDIVSHAVVEGQYLFEQTFYPNINSMHFYDLSPQYILANKYSLSTNQLIS